MTFFPQEMEPIVWVLSLGVGKLDWKELSRSIQAWNLPLLTTSPVSRTMYRPPGMPDIRKTPIILS